LAYPSLTDFGAEARTPLPPHVREETVPAMLAGCVADAPHRIALVAYSATGGEVSLTYTDLAAMAEHVAGGFADLGVVKGSRIALLLSNWSAIEGHVAVHAAHRLGAIVVPINVRSVPAEVGWCVENTGCRWLVYEPGQSDKADALRERLATVDFIALESGRGDVAWSTLMDHAPADQTPVSPTDAANWVFTSGTTGYPKVVAHTHSTCVGCGLQVADTWDLHPGDVYLNGHPFFTASGTNTDLMAALYSRCTQVVEPSFSPEQSIARVKRFGATSIFWMTPMLSLIFKSDVLQRGDLNGVRRVLYGGQAMAPAFHLLVDDTLAVGHGVELVHMIGQSEAGPSGIMLEPAYHREKLGSVGNRGFSAEWTEYAVLATDGEIQGPGGEGELCYRTPSIMEGYVGAPEASREAIHDGWLHSGDVLRLDEDGFAFFVDRMKDVIRRGGVNIASAEIERALRECSGIADVAAVPYPHEVLGEVVKVVVVRGAGAMLNSADVIEFATGRLADFKVPRVVEFRDELPRNDMGKIQKAQLR
jgi:acyl-CoA synthetase (AMP-forming)/AMP-acid ligase II